jgi:hypothetical protein
MPRKAILHKNKNISISLPEYQLNFINEHSEFSISKFVQIHVKDYIDSFYELESIKKEVDNNDKKTA